MKSTTKYIGLDVSKEKIAVAIADEGRDAPRFWGTIDHRIAAVRKLLRQLGEPDTLLVCYEAGAMGFELHRWLLSMKVSCIVVAPSLIPVRAGDRIKTDRRDALRLAQLLRANELTAVHVPSPEDEALRDIVRARKVAKEDLHRARQRLVHFLLRHQVHPPETMKNRWTKMYRKWLEAVKMPRDLEQIVLDDYRHSIFLCEERLARLESHMVEYTMAGEHAPIITAFQALRGIALITSITLVAEIGDFMRFSHPKQLMSYLGLVPREYSTGETVRRGRMTKTGNSHARNVLIESSWSYRYRPAIKGRLLERLKGQKPEIQDISWKAQERLHKKYRRLHIQKGKEKNIVIGAIARELVGFIWAISRHVEPPPLPSPKGETHGIPSLHPDTRRVATSLVKLGEV